MWIHEKLNAKFAFCLSGLSVEQGCQMVYFQTKNCNLGKFRKGYNGIYWYILWTFGLFKVFEIFYGHLVYFVVIWYIFPRVGILYQEISGSPAVESQNVFLLTAQR
jgi:hypothetical protein